MKANRRQVLSIGVSAAVAAVTAPLVRSSAAAAAGLQVTNLGLLPGTTNSTAADINALGVVVGNSFTANGPGQYMRAFRWAGNGLEDLGTLAGGTNANAVAINRKGWCTTCRASCRAANPARCGSTTAARSSAGHSPRTARTER